MEIIAPLLPAAAVVAAPVEIARVVAIEMRHHLVIATRGSALALWQANNIKESLEEIDPTIRISLNIIKTQGDRILDTPLAAIGGKGLFVKEIEEALLDGRADLAVHSIKDVPMILPEGLILGCVPKREACTDCFLSMNFNSLEELPRGARLGTSSLRRQAQLLHIRPDLRIESLRGNIDTRLHKLEKGEYDAIVLATAGLFRLGLHARHMQPLDIDTMMPAVGQGALGIECLEDKYELLVLLAQLEDRDTRVCVDTERAFLATLNGGCQVPIGAHASMEDEETIVAEGIVARTDGSIVLRARKSGDASKTQLLGSSLANELMNNGADAILREFYHAD